MKITFWPTVFFLALFLLLINLGFWQLRRYHYKENLLQEFHLAIKASPASLDDILALKNPEFRRIQISGHYINSKTILLANQFAQHQSGYDVITPLMISADNKAVLIDRGWVSTQTAANPNLMQADQQLINLTGYVKFPYQHVFILGPTVLNPNQFPLQVQKIDLKTLSQATQLNLYPFIIRLSKTEPNGFYREWVITTVMPERHMAYAVQWFLMAIVLIIIYLYFLSSLSRKRFARRGRGLG